MNGSWAWEQFEADGTFLIKYDMQDDAKPAHTVRCVWMGTINDPRGTWSGR